MLLWAIASHHCSLEQASGLEFLRCAPEAHESNDGSDPCREAGSCSIEDAQYHLPRQLGLAPIVGPASFHPEGPYVVEQLLPKEVRLGILTAAPPDLLASWRFFTRTALPVRAPSVPS